MSLSLHKITQNINYFILQYIYKILDFMSIFQEQSNCHQLLDIFQLQDLPCSFNQNNNLLINHEINIQQYQDPLYQHRNYQSAQVEHQNIISTEQECLGIKRRKSCYIDANDKNKRNDTKNIPKNYGKAITGFIRKNHILTNQILDKLSIDKEEFYEFIKQKSRTINSISDLRNFWSDNIFSRPIRILSYQFVRKHSLSYIFKSRIKNHMTHIKYREKIMNGIKDPENFNNIKDY